MLRSYITVGVVACVLAVYAPSLFPAMLQSMGAGGGAPQMAAQPVARPAVAEVSDPPSEEAGSVEIYADASGQYSANVEINGSLVRMLVDTGATTVALSADTAQRLGFSLSEANYTVGVRTANGAARAAPVTLTGVSIGDIHLTDVQGMVLERQAGHVDLLGMSFLKRLSGVEQKSGRLILRQ